MASRRTFENGADNGPNCDLNKAASDHLTVLAETFPDYTFFATNGAGEIVLLHRPASARPGLIVGAGRDAWVDLGEGHAHATITSGDGVTPGHLHAVSSLGAPAAAVVAQLRLCAAVVGRSLSRADASAESYFEMIGGISRFTAHALGNPLTGLGLTLDLLASMVKEDNLTRLVGRCQRINERLSVFKENLGALGGSIKGQRAPIELLPIIEQTLEAQRLGASYETPIELAPGAPQQAFCHAGLIAMALGYLFRNASDAIPEGGTLGVRVSAHEGMTRLTVWDDGPGVAKDLVDSLFAAPVSTRPQGGGMGLMLVAMIVERIHGGRVSYDARTPRGAQFHLDLPGHGTMEEGA